MLARRVASIALVVATAWMPAAIGTAAATVVPSQTHGIVVPADDRLPVLFERGQWRQAVALAQKRLENDPNDAAALRTLARIDADLGRFDEATKFAERAVAAAPRSADAHFALAVVNGLQAERASVLKKPGLGKKFKREAEATLAIDPNHVEAMVGMIRFHRQAPGIVGGDKKKAVEFTERLMRVDPTEAWLQKATIAFDESDSAAGERGLRKAVEAAGKPEAKLALANYLAAPWRAPDESARLAREAVAAEPWRVGAWSLLAIRAASQKQYTDLDGVLEQAEAAVSGNLGPHYQAARVMATQGGDPVRAEALLRRYLGVEPELGFPTHAGAHWRLGLALERQGRKPEAIKEVEAAVKLDPKLENAKKDLKRMKS